MSNIQSINYFKSIQKSISDTILSNDFIKSLNLKILLSDDKQISYEIESAIKQLGLTVVIDIPSLTFGGKIQDTQNDLKNIWWTIDNLSISIIEVPTIRSFSCDYSSYDIALIVAETLYQKCSFLPQSINKSVDGETIFTTINLKTNIGFRFSKNEEGEE